MSSLNSRCRAAGTLSPPVYTPAKRGKRGAIDAGHTKHLGHYVDVRADQRGLMSPERRHVCGRVKSVVQRDGAAGQQRGYGRDEPTDVYERLEDLYDVVRPDIAERF